MTSADKRSNNGMQRTALRAAAEPERSAKEMKIETKEHADAVNGKFNHFHDGFIKQIRVTSDNEFLTDMPWEEQRQFPTNEEELQAAGLCLLNTNSVELVIHHYNYDWPNQPRRRSIVIRAKEARMTDGLLKFIGADIFELAFSKDDGGIACVLTHHADDAGPVRSMDNGTTTVLFSADVVELEETEWAERTPAGDVLKAAPEE
ncbi:MAG: hypothetical protein GHCLOJNM_03483 [bacterium]|nr:hypothetical protein [bacterium]